MWILKCLYPLIFGHFWRDCYLTCESPVLLSVVSLICMWHYSQAPERFLRISLYSWYLWWETGSSHSLWPFISTCADGWLSALWGLMSFDSGKYSSFYPISALSGCVFLETPLCGCWLYPIASCSNAAPWLLCTQISQRLLHCVTSTITVFFFRLLPSIYVDFRMSWFSF